MSQRKKLGLALGAGSARGFAHIGALQVLREHNISIDVVTGCSMGALIGALYVTGCDIYFLEKYAINFNLSHYLDFSLVNKGFVKGNKIVELLKILTKNKRIEEADIPFSCVAINVSTGELKVFDKGPLYQAVRASISIPGVFVPYEIDGNYYIDGGMLERLPVGAARDLGADVVLGIDVSYHGEKMPVPKHTLGTMQNTMNIMGWEIARHRIYKSDVLVIPDVYHIDPNSTKDAQLCIQRGREAMLKKVDQVKEMVEG